MARDKVMVATLNEGSGKTPSSKRKRTLDVKDISFTPAKKARTTGGLNRKSNTTPAEPRPRRNSLSLPEDAVSDTAQPLQKRLRKLKSVKESLSNPSPLKATGFSPKEIVAPGRVNLNESPAKGSRNRPASILPPKVIEPPPSATTTTTPRKRPTRLSVKKGEIQAPPETWDKDQQGQPADQVEDQVNEVLQMGQEVDTEPMQEQDEVAPQVGGDEEPIQGNKAASPPEQSPERRTVSKGSTQKKKKKRAPEPPVIEPPDTVNEEMSESKKQRSKEREAFSANKELTKLEEAEKLREDEEAFVAQIYDTAHWYDCFDDWLAMGGAARQIRTEGRGEQLQSEQCRSLRQALQQLTRLLRDHVAGKVSIEETREKVTKLIADIENTCDALDSVSSAKGRKRIVSDLYQHIIADAIYALKGYMRCFGDQEESFIGWELCHFVHLLAVVEDLTIQATTWKPKPTHVDGEYREKIRLRVRPQIRRVHGVYKGALDDMEEKAIMQQEMKELYEAQQLALATRARRQQQMYDKIRRDKQRPRPPQRPQISEEIFDIDDFGPSTLSAPTQVREHGQPITPISAKPRLERQGTEDIAPPPMDWTDDEKAALLNALELYQGDDRYWQIQDACTELRDRSLDDLRTAALYFRELISSAAEFAGKVHSTFAYLMSVE